MQWQTTGGVHSALKDFGLTAADALGLARESEQFELAVDGVLLRRLAGSGSGVLGGASSVPVLPATSAVPAALAPGGVADKG